MPDISELLPRYRRYALLERGLQPQTVKQTIALAGWLTDFAQTWELHQLDTAMVREFLHDGREHRLWSAKTFRLYRQYLKGFFSWCVDSGYIERNPIDPIENPRLPKKIPQTLSRDQAVAVLSHVRWINWHYELEAPRNEAILAMFIYTGIRLSELLSLSADDVDIEGAEIFVQSGKGGNGRKLAIHPRLLTVLRSYERARRRVGASSRWYFPSVRSPAMLTNKNLYNVFDRVSASVGFKVRPHMLRHTFGRLCVEANVNLRVVQAMMGHAQVTTTQIYTQVSTDAMKRSLGATPLL